MSAKFNTSDEIDTLLEQFRGTRLLPNLEVSRRDSYALE